MKLSTSRILAQLSEQDRNKVELELAELHTQQQLLLRKQDDILARIKQVNQQRDHALKNRNAASLLQSFNVAVQEQHLLLAQNTLAMDGLEEQKQALLSRFADVYRIQHAYESIHSKQQQWQQRHDEQKTQRQLDDMVAARSSRVAW